MDSVAQKSVSGILWVGGGGLAKAIIHFIPIMILTRVLSPSDFGVFSLILAVVYVAELLSFGGVGPTLVQSKTLTRPMIAAAIWVALGVGGTLAILIMCVAGFAASAFGMPTLHGPLIAVALGFPINAFSVIGARLQQRELRQSYQIKADILSYLIGYYIIGLGMAFYGYGVWSLIGAFLTQSIVRSAMLGFAVRRHLSFRTTAAHLLDMVRGSLPLMLSHLLFELQLTADKVIVGYTLNAASLGIYGRTSDLSIRIMKLFDQIIQRVAFPSFSRKNREDTPERPPEGADLQKSLFLIFFCVFPLVIYLWAFSETLIVLAFGEIYRVGAAPFTYLGLALLPVIMARTCTAWLQAQGLFGLTVKIEAASALSFIGMVWAGVTIGGTTGAAAAILINSSLKAYGALVAARMAAPSNLRKSMYHILKSVPFIALILFNGWLINTLNAHLTGDVIQLIIGSTIYYLAIGIVVGCWPKLFLGPIQAVIFGLLSPQRPQIFQGFLRRFSA